MPVEYVRVRIKESGAHKSIPWRLYDANPSLFELLKQPATLSDGRPLPDKPKTTVSTEADKKAGQTAATPAKEK